MISVCMPTRKRPKTVAELVTSVANTVTNPVEVVLYVDDDDLETHAAFPDLQGISEFVTVVPRFGPRLVMSDYWNKCAEKATGDILMLCCDSVIFKTPRWDRMVEAEFEKWPDRIGLVYGNDEIHHGAAATLPFLHHRWIEIVGRFVPPYFSCDWCDTWLTEIARNLGRFSYLPQMVTQHRHPEAGTAPLDETKLEGYARNERDHNDVIYREYANERNAEMHLLKAAMC